MKCATMRPVSTELETPTEYERFKSLLNRVLAVPRATIIKREEEYQFHSAGNPSRPGPKRKRKWAASPGPGGAPPA